MGIGAVVKIAVGAFLIPKIGIFGCAVGTFCCYSVASILNGYFIESKLNINVEYMKSFLHSLICAIPATGLAHLLYRKFYEIFGNTIACTVAVALCALIYVTAILLSGYFKIKDIACVLHFRRRYNRE